MDIWVVGNEFQKAKDACRLHQMASQVNMYNGQYGCQKRCCCLFFVECLWNMTYELSALRCHHLFACVSGCTFSHSSSRSVTWRTLALIGSASIGVARAVSEIACECKVVYYVSRPEQEARRISIFYEEMFQFCVCGFDLDLRRCHSAAYLSHLNVSHQSDIRTTGGG
jgi:hypothetical protein